MLPPIVLLFTALNLLNYLDRTLVPAVLPSILTEFSLDEVGGGRLTSAFVLGYMLCSPVFGIMGDRFSRPKLMTFGVVAWSVATALSGVATSFTTFYLARILVGVGEASFVSIAPGYLKDLLKDPVRLNGALAVFYCAIPVGSAMGYVFGGLLAKGWGWRSPFFVAGAGGVILSLLLLRLREVRPQLRETEEPLGIVAGLKRICAVPILWFAILGYVMNAFGLYGISTFMVPYGVSIGFAKEDVAIYFGLILIFTGLVGTLLGGRLASRLVRGKPSVELAMLPFVGITALASVPFLVLAFSVQSHAAFLVLCLIAETLLFAGTAPLNSIIVLAAPAGLAALTQGVTIFALNLFGAFTAPQIVGWCFKVYSGRVGMLISTTALGASALIWMVGWLVLKRRAHSQL